MRQITIVTLMLSVFACSQPEIGPRVLKVSAYNSPTIDREVAENDPYRLTMEIEDSANGKQFLVVTLKPQGGSFFVSPHSKQDFSGVFRVELPQNEYVTLGEDFEEIPRSLEVIDNHPFVRGSVNWVHEGTKYKFPLVLKANGDFQTSGWIRFVIEPKCTLEEIPFDLMMKGNQLTAQRYPRLMKELCGES